MEAAKTYHHHYPGSPAEAYVKARGLDSRAVAFGLGYVADSAIPGHEQYRGYLAIPYLRPAGGAHGVATIRFRCIADKCVKDAQGRYLVAQGLKETHTGHGKYLSQSGDPPRIFNSAALVQASPYLALPEGELDVMAWAVAGVPAAGIPGTGSWRDYWAPAFRGYRTVYLIAEGDEAGRNLMNDLGAKLPNKQIVRLPDGQDSNSLLLAEGPARLRERLGI
ncbi:toprim domain-containing protein [Streptomyces buecherae]|uniref:toprim domain-containing protein n=1 Tax=Streptomyces buecherae TaxID=2763006 RepID=UPI001E2A66BF|nr:toprim domain-containing protein [Streptomyces buecherae]